MTSLIEESLQQGILAHKEGRLEEAESLYRTVLQSEPNHPGANYNLGLVADSVGKPQLAIVFFRIALEINPQPEQFWTSLIDALIKVGKFEDASNVIKGAKDREIAADKLSAYEMRLSAVFEEEPIRELIAAERFEEAERLSLSMTVSVTTTW